MCCWPHAHIGTGAALKEGGIAGVVIAIIAAIVIALLLVAIVIRKRKAVALLFAPPKPVAQNVFLQIEEEMVREFHFFHLLTSCLLCLGTRLNNTMPS